MHEAELLLHDVLRVGDVGGAQLQVVRHRHPGEKVALLRHQGDAHAGNLVGLQRKEVPAVGFQPARPRGAPCP